ncbi:MAG: glutamine amidotransferase [Firmicutes bacterium]|nr:glutamine amidotransferase [Bacillota bacterium]
MKLSICHLYPDLLNLYGDRGNIIILCQRLQWRGIRVELTEVSIGDEFEASKYDLLFMGGGPDQEQSAVSRDLAKKGPYLVEAVENGLVVLSICGGYQLLGKSYVSRTGDNLPGVGIFDAVTTAGTSRLRGNIAIRVHELPEDYPVVGFENHSGRTVLGTASPFGQVIFGAGNNGQDKTEGARYRNAFGTYLHGPILGKNPHLADYLLTLALRRRYGEIVLKPLDDSLEKVVNQQFFKRFGG